MDPNFSPPPPPRWLHGLLQRLVAPHLREEVLGDLHERYYRRLHRLGERNARLAYWWEGLNYLRPAFLKRKPSDYPIPFFLNPAMIRSYFIVAWRNLIRNKAFSVINLVGLALGMACSMLIFLWVDSERSVDQFHANQPHLYQIYERQFQDGKVNASYFTQGLLADELKKQVPEVELSCSMETIRPKTFRIGNRILKLPGTFAGEDFFSMFSYPLLQGTARSALLKPGGIAISRKMAEEFYGSPAAAMGKLIRYENREDLLVTAVFENVPALSSLQFDFIRNWVDFIKENPWATRWGNSDPFTYIQLRTDLRGTGADPARVEAKIRDFVHRYIPRQGNAHTELGLQPYTEKYLYSSFTNGRIDGGRIEYVRLLSLVAVIILLIACINFMNLATARSTKRSREVGVRKVIGAARVALIGQFLGEAILLAFLSLLLALLLVALALPAFVQLTGKPLSLPFDDPRFWPGLLGLVVLTGLMSGSYPAFFLSSLRPVRVLKGALTVNQSAAFFRRSLVVAQFGLSIILMVGTLVVYRQMEFVQTSNLGYARENLIYIPLEGELVKKFTLFKEKAGKMAGILNVSRMSESPTEIGHHVGDVSWVGKDPNLVTSFSNAKVGYDFVKTLKLTLVEGRDFSREFATDSLNFLINETALRKIGYRDPIGKPLVWGQRRGTIIGVLKDFHFNSMRQSIEPLVVKLDENRPYGTILIRVEGDKTRNALANLEKLSKELNPETPFTYQFSDLEYAKLYRSEQIVSQLANYFALLAILISCLGLFGLAAFTTEQRTREIGVRKVLGASVVSILAMLTRDFLRLVLIALLLASPLAWYVMGQWLQGFAYKIALQWWMFAVAGLLAVAVALLAVSFQTVRAALMNPVKSLRND